MTVFHLLSDNSCCSEAVKWKEVEEEGGRGGIPQRNVAFYLYTNPGISHVKSCLITYLLLMYKNASLSHK